MSQLLEQRYEGMQLPRYIRAKLTRGPHYVHKLVKNIIRKSPPTRWIGRKFVYFALKELQAYYD
jgi:hypothetical protein